MKYLFLFFSLIENRSISHTTYPDYSFPPFTPPSCSHLTCPLLLLSFCLSLEYKKLLRDKTQTYQNKIECKTETVTSQWGHATQWKQKISRSRQKNQRPPCSHTQKPHKIMKVKAIVGTQKTQKRPIAVLCFALWVSEIHMNLDQLIQPALFFWCPPSTLSPNLPLLLLPWGSLNTEGRNLMETFCLELCGSRTLSLYNV